MSTLTHLEVPAVQNLEANHTAGYVVLHGGPGDRKSRDAAQRPANGHRNTWLLTMGLSGGHAKPGIGGVVFVG